MYANANRCCIFDECKCKCKHLPTKLTDWEEARLSQHRAADDIYGQTIDARKSDCVCHGNGVSVAPKRVHGLLSRHLSVSESRERLRILDASAASEAWASALLSAFDQDDAQADTQACSDFSCDFV